MKPWLWALLELAPTPQRAAKLTQKRLKQLLSKHRIRRWTAEEVGEILTAPPLPLAAGSAEAISEHALLLLPQLRLLHLQRKQIADRTQQLLDHMAASTVDFPESQEHRDIPVLLSGRAERNISLRRKQFELAIAGNTTMLIWLGKQYLGQKDNPEVSSENGCALQPPSLTVNFLDTFLEKNRLARESATGKKAVLNTRPISPDEDHVAGPVKELTNGQ